MIRRLIILLLIVGCEEFAPTVHTHTDGTAVTTYMGNVYIIEGALWSNPDSDLQEGGVGYASYHFDTDDSVYISYSNFPEFDFGNNEILSFPDKKYFSNMTFNELNRKFIGTIEWEDSSLASTFLSQSRWDYEMIFSNDYLKIDSGSVIQYDLDGDSVYTALFGSDINYILFDPSNPPNIYGCTDYSAENFNPNANIYDNSCEYSESQGQVRMIQIGVLDKMYTERNSNWVTVYYDDIETSSKTVVLFT